VLFWIYAVVVLLNDDVVVVVFHVRLFVFLSKLKGAGGAERRSIYRQ